MADAVERTIREEYGTVLKFFKAFALVAFCLLARQAAAEVDSPYVLAFGDSLTAGYRLDPGDSFPAQLERRLLADGHPIRVVNAGVSGDTTSSGLTRLDWAIEGEMHSRLRLAIVALGANDALRGIDPAITRANLEKILTRFRRENIPVLLVGMRSPPNMGRAYGREFESIFPDLAEEYEVALYPFFLEGVAATPSLNLSDGMHPNKDGVQVIVTGIVPLVKMLLRPN